MLLVLILFLVSVLDINNGLIIQGGTLNNVSTGQQNIYFPITFTKSMCLSVTCHMPNGSYYFWGLMGWDLSSFGINVRLANGTVASNVSFITYIAIGV